MYSVGDIVEYKTAAFRRAWSGHVVGGDIKTGKIVEAFSTLNNHPCYWIDGEKELILHDQIRRKI